MFAPHPHCHQFPTQSITRQPFYSHDLTAFTSVLSQIVKQAWAGSALKNRDWEFRWIDWKRLNDGSSIIKAGKWGELWDSNWNSDKAVFEAVCLSSDWTGERCLGAAIAKAVQRRVRGFEPRLQLAGAENPNWRTGPVLNVLQGEGSSISDTKPSTHFLKSHCMHWIASCLGLWQLQSGGNFSSSPLIRQYWANFDIDNTQQRLYVYCTVKRWIKNGDILT